MRLLETEPQEVNLFEQVFPCRLGFPVVVSDSHRRLAGGGDRSLVVFLYDDDRRPIVGGGAVGCVVVDPMRRGGRHDLIPLRLMMVVVPPTTTAMVVVPTIVTLGRRPPSTPSGGATVVLFVTGGETTPTPPVEIYLRPGCIGVIILVVRRRVVVAVTVAVAAMSLAVVVVCDGTEFAFPVDLLLLLLLRVCIVCHCRVAVVYLVLVRPWCHRRLHNRLWRLGLPHGYRVRHRQGHRHTDRLDRRSPLARWWHRNAIVHRRLHCGLLEWRGIGDEGARFHCRHILLLDATVLLPDIAALGGLQGPDLLLHILVVAAEDGVPDDIFVLDPLEIVSVIPRGTYLALPCVCELKDITHTQKK